MILTFECVVESKLLRRQTQSGAYSSSRIQQDAETSKLDIYTQRIYVYRVRLIVLSAHIYIGKRKNLEENTKQHRNECCDSIQAINNNIGTNVDQHSLYGIVSIE